MNQLLNIASLRAITTLAVLCLSYQSAWAQYNFDRIKESPTPSPRQQRLIGDVQLSANRAASEARQADAAYSSFNAKSRNVSATPVAQGTPANTSASGPLTFECTIKCLSRSSVETTSYSMTANSADSAAKMVSDLADQICVSRGYVRATSSGMSSNQCRKR